MYKNIEEFYLSLPKEVLEIGFELEYNAKIKKSIKSVRINKSKLKKIIEDDISSRKFINFLYEKYEVEKYKFKGLTDVIARVSNDNNKEAIIYTINEFLGDNKFNKNLSLLMTKIEENFKNINEVQEEYIGNNKVKNIIVLKRMEEYLNIYTVAEINKTYIKTIDKDERQKRYPNHGNINVYMTYNSKLKNMDIDEEELKILSFSNDELRENGNKSNYKIDEKYILDEDRFYDIESENIFEIQDVIEDSKSIEYKLRNKENIMVDEYSKKNIYIKNNKYIYGPFKTENIGRGCRLVLAMEYLVYKYSIEENKDQIEFESIEIGFNYRQIIKNIIYFKGEKIKKEEIDLIDNQNLLNLLNEKIIKINQINKIYKKDEIQSIRANILSLINNNFSEKRINRIKEMLIETENMEKFIIDELVEILSNLIEVKAGKNILVEKIFSNSENLRKLQNYNIIETKIENKTKDLEELNKKLKDIEEKIKNKDGELEANSINISIEKNNSEITSLEKEKKSLKMKIKDLEERYGLINKYIDVEKLKKEASEEERNYQTFNKKSEEWKRKIERLEDNFKTKLTQAINSCEDIAFEASFEGLIANEMMKKASEWGHKLSDDKYKDLVMKMENLQNKKIFKDKLEIIDYLYKLINRERNYSKNEIINFMICINQGFLTIFGGEPGVGKTSICTIIGQALGLIDNGINDRYIEVSVEKGWTSKRDFIGYYNPLTKEFDKANKKLFEAFNVLNIEKKDGIKDVPFYVLLDEANLSSIEHYWADFMNVCDLNKKNRNVSLGDGYSYEIPETLRFLATINYDHTTETLSPRLIDRAWIINLENNYIKNSKGKLSISDEKNNIILYKDIKKVFGESSLNDNENLDEIIDVLDSIYEKFFQNNISISSRVQNMIIEYLNIGYNLFESTESTAKEFVALDYAISQKILPKIDGYGDNYKEFLGELEDIFDKNNMMKSKNIIKRILYKGDKNMEYYQFFI